MSKKTLKFIAELAPLILSGEKNSTWRLNDDKDLQTGDMVTFIKRPELVEFATAELTSVIEKPFSQLTDADKSGHEKYKSDEQTYKSFSQCYKMPVDGSTPVKIIKFRLIELFHEE